MLGTPGEDGVFRYEPPAYEKPETSSPEQDDPSVADWFDTAPDPVVAEAVRAAEEVARKEVPGPLERTSVERGVDRGTLGASPVAREVGAGEPAPGPPRE